jgi:enterochelin esterase-like enzyme
MAAPDQRFAALYLQHGVADTEYSWEVHGRLSSSVDDLIRDGQIDPLVVVMPFDFMNQKQKLARTFP